MRYNYLKESQETRINNVSNEEGTSTRLDTDARTNEPKSEKELIESMKDTT